MKKICKKKGGNVGHDSMYLCFYDHNFPYAVRHFNFKYSFGFAHTRFIFNAAVVWGGQVVETKDIFSLSSFNTSSIMPWYIPCRALSNRRLGCDVRNDWNIEPMKN